MDHCEYHTGYNPGCQNCRDARRRAEEDDDLASTVSMDAAMSANFTTESVIADSSSLTSTFTVPDATLNTDPGFSVDTNSGGDFGGGGAGGDY